MGDPAFRLLTLDSITTDSQHAGTTNCGLATPSYIGNPWGTRVELNPACRPRHGQNLYLPLN